MPTPTVTGRFGSASTLSSFPFTIDSSAVAGQELAVAFVVRANVGFHVGTLSGFTRISGHPDATGTSGSSQNDFPNTCIRMGTNSTSGNIQFFSTTLTTGGAQTFTFTSPYSLSAIHVGFWALYPAGTTFTVGGSNKGTTSTSPATAAITDTSTDAVDLLRVIGGTVASSSTAMTGSAVAWDVPTKLWDRQGGGTSGFTWGSLAREVGPTPHGAVSARTITLTNAPTNWATGTLIASSGGTPPAPVNTSAPFITDDGSPETGETLTLNVGSWSNSPTAYSIHWRRNGSNIVSGSGYTTTNYTLQVADEGQVIDATVAASNAGGTSTPPTATSNTTTPTPPPPTPVPVNTVQPFITGTKQVGQTVTCNPGTWTNSPTVYAYQWLRSGSAISGATAQTYVLTASDVGTDKVSCRVTPSNAGGPGVPANATSISPTIAPGDYPVSEYLTL